MLPSFWRWGFPSNGLGIVADIGNGTMNVIFIFDGKPDSSRYYTERFGVECCVIEMRSELTNMVHSVVDDCIVNLGGGAMLMKHFAKLDQRKVHFIEDIHANAKGYEYLSNQRRLRSLRRG